MTQTVTQSEHINMEQPTYNGLNRSAMVLGVPLMPLAVCGFALIMTRLLAASFLGGKALLLLAMGIPVFLGLRTISANDDQAFKIYALEAKWFIRRKNAALFGGTSTILATKYGRQQSDYQRFLEQGAQGTAGTIGLYAENLPTRYQ